ncbi:MAG: four helix bundle protein [Cyclobacteriaceae bacterium]
MKNYKDLKVWEKAHQATLLVYEITKKFPTDEKFNLISQIRRAATSIPTNIAEGCGKFTDKDFANFLQVSLGSTHEVEYLLLLSCDLGYLEKEQFNSLTKEISEVKAMLISLIKKVRTK